MINDLGWPTRLTRQAQAEGEHVLYDHMLKNNLLKVEVERQQRITEQPHEQLKQSTQKAQREEFLRLLAQGLPPREAMERVKK